MHCCGRRFKYRIAYNIYFAYVHCIHPSLWVKRWILPSFTAANAKYQNKMQECVVQGARQASTNTRQAQPTEARHQTWPRSSLYRWAVSPKKKREGRRQLTLGRWGYNSSAGLEILWLLWVTQKRLLKNCVSEMLSEAGGSVCGGGETYTFTIELILWSKLRILLVSHVLLEGWGGSGIRRHEDQNFLCSRAIYGACSR